MNSTENNNKRSSTKKKILVCAGIVFAICIALGIYQFIKLKQNEARALEVYTTLKKNNELKFEFRNRLSNNFTRFLLQFPIPYSIAKFIPTDPVIGTIEIQNFQCSDYIMNLGINLMDLETGIFINAGMTDENSSFLKKQTHLKKLNLSQNEITDKTLIHFQEFTSLEELDLSNTNITDEGIIQLAKKGIFKNLRSLNLSHTTISDQVANHLAQLEMLVILKMNQTKVTDETVKIFSKNHIIHTLELVGTHITDKSVDLILSMERMRNPLLYETNISKEGFEKLTRTKYLWMKNP